MADGGSDCISLVCGGCCLIMFSGLTAFCGAKRYGSGSGSGTAGCCNSCCRSSFDEDAFDAEVKKDLERTRDSNAQPISTTPMTAAPMTTDLSRKPTPPTTQTQEAPQTTLTAEHD